MYLCRKRKSAIGNTQLSELAVVVQGVPLRMHALTSVDVFEVGCHELIPEGFAPQGGTSLHICRVAQQRCGVHSQQVHVP